MIGETTLASPLALEVGVGEVAADVLPFALRLQDHAGGAIRHLPEIGDLVQLAADRQIVAPAGEGVARRNSAWA